MIHRPELLDAVSKCPSGGVDASHWRHVFGTRPPDTENTRGARWNPRGLAALYVSSSRDGAIAEGDHAAAVQPYRPRVARFVYEVGVRLENAMDLRELDDLAQVGLRLEDLASDDLGPCQEVGAAVAWLGHDGLQVPSARSEASNLVVFPDHQGEKYRFDHGRPEELS